MKSCTGDTEDYPMREPSGWPIVGEAPEPTAEQIAKAEELEAEAERDRQRSRDSFDRCDTDGCVSQWCSDWSAREADERAEILRNGGCATFPALHYLNADGTMGERVRAKLIDTRYGTSFAILKDGSDEFAGEFVGAYLTERTYTRKGYVRVEEWAPAWAKLSGSGSGLSGLTSLYVKTFRTDGR